MLAVVVTNPLMKSAHMLKLESPNVPRSLTIDDELIGPNQIDKNVKKKCSRNHDSNEHKSEQGD